MTTIARIASLILLLLAGTAAAAPRADLWERWTRHGPASARTVDHGAWDALLKAHVVAGPDGIHRVRYGAFSPADRAALAGYLAALQAVPVDELARDEQRAFWINLYNALTISIVLDRYPVESIRDIRISPGMFSVGPWGLKIATVAGEPVSLDDIEHRILRPIWRDPRIHYAVNCASLGCPNLPREAFTAANAERLLGDGARAYVNHPRGARVDGGRLMVSSIYVWFREDFGGSDAGVLAHLRAHADPPLAAALAGVTRIAGDGYDWALNDAP
ncbi:MAG: DUF547 domain-containing protein [Alphaproteobacteria bacterium]